LQTSPKLLLDDFVFINNVDEKNNRAEVLDWSANGGLRIGNLKTIYEDENVFCAKHSVTQENTGPSSVIRRISCSLLRIILGTCHIQIRIN
jgi:hypothetical protein